MNQESALLKRLTESFRNSLAMVVLSLSAFGQPASVSITSPSDGSTVVAGQPVTVAVSVTGVAGLQAVQVFSPAFGITSAATQGPFSFSVTFPPDALGSQQLTAGAFTRPGVGTFSKTIAVVVVPPSVVASFSTNVTSISFSFIGETARIRATGQFLNGVSADITSLPSTKFSSQDGRVATVDGSGNVIARGSGTTTVTVQNGSLSASIAVSVPAAVRGDLNGDGRVDQDDLNLLIRAVGTPVSGPFDARDLNGDGVIDSKDVDVLQTTCSPRCLPGGQIVPVMGVVNGASFAANPLAPGGLFTIFTSGLAAAELSAPAAPFPTSLGGVIVTVNGIDVPLLYVSPNQINAQMPYELPPGPATLTVTAGASFSLVIPIDIVPAAPGLFLSSGRRAIVQNQDYRLNSTANPAGVGSFIIAYFTGQGALDQAISTGAVAPPTVLSRTKSATSATVGGLPAQVMYSGMTPGYVGLAQANIVVPNLPSGEFPLILTIGGVISNAGMISVDAPN